MYEVPREEGKEEVVAIAIVKYHENFSAGVLVSRDGSIHLQFIEDTGTEVHVFPFSKDAAIQFADQVKQKSTGLVVPGATADPE